jgi:hypothetical protein
MIENLVGSGRIARSPDPRQHVVGLRAVLAELQRPAGASDALGVRPPGARNQRRWIRVARTMRAGPCAPIVLWDHSYIPCALALDVKVIKCLSPLNVLKDSNDHSN